MAKTAPEALASSSGPSPAAWLAPFALLALALVAVAVMAATLDDYLLTLAAIVFLNVMLATSLNLTNGLTGLFSLGHPAFMTIGGYVAAVLTYPVWRKDFMLPDLPVLLSSAQTGLLPALLAGGAAAALVALLVGFAVLRLRGHYLAVATLGLIIIVRVLATNWEGYTRGGMGLNGVPQLTDLWWAFGAMAVTLAVCWRVKLSSLGRAMMATRENEMAAECIGIDTFRVRMTAFTLGAFFAGVAGALMVHLITVVTPGSYSVALAFNLVAMVVIGGTGSVAGAALAAVALTLLSEALRPVEEGLGLYGLSQVIVALALLLFLLMRPQGLFGSREPILLRRLFGADRE
jgi:branched-chain amino acid transport system permease protein